MTHAPDIDITAPPTCDPITLEIIQGAIQAAQS